jgi:DNA-binding protein Fis
MLKTEGNKTKAAELLQISYKSFCDKLKEYKIN